MRDLPTYTSIFRLERRLYKIYDFELPHPVGLWTALAFLLALPVFYLLGNLIGISPSAETAWFYLVLPGFAAWVAGQPVADRKRPHDWVASQLRYLLEPRTLHRLAEPREPSATRMRATVWSRPSPHTRGSE